MEKVSIQVLKKTLSATVAEAEAGRTVLVTRHNTPVARLGPAEPAHVHRGRSVGKATLRPAVKRGTGGRYLAVLLDDRGVR